MLIEQRRIDKIEIVTEFKHLQIRYADEIIEDTTGEVKGMTYFRTVVNCDDDTAAIANGVDDIANVVWTTAVRDAYAAFVAAQTI